ncbi:hypothetical protein ScPMuIL_005824 [Solemya velum]
MSAGPLVIEIICTCVLAAFLLHRYGDLRKQHVLVTLATFVAWYFSFMIIFVLPLDVSSTFYRQCLKDRFIPVTTPSTYNSTMNNITVVNNATPSVQSPSNLEDTQVSASLQGNPDVGETTSASECEVPLSHVPDHVLPALWHVVYWTSQVLTWLILPMMQSYSNAGDFSVGGKVKSALIENAIYYGTYLLIFGICLIYVAARPDLDIDADKLKVIGVTASNTWGLFVLVLMLGYGLVEVPRNMWNSSKRGMLLGRSWFKVSKLSTEKTEAEENLEDILEEIKRASDNIRYNHPLRKHMDTILFKCPESMRQSVKKNIDDYEDYSKAQDTLSEKALVRLHKRVIRASQTNHRTQTQWNLLLEKCFDLEDMSANEGRQDRIYKHSFGDYNRGFWRSIYTPTIEWYWKCLIRPWVLRVGAVFLTVLSFMVVWSECLFFVKSPVLSLFAVFIDLAKEHYDYVYIEFASILTIAYLCICAYYSVFQIRILNYYYIAPYHQTDEYSIIFTGMMLCRLTPPMCLNFLGLIHLDSHVTKDINIEETSYSQIMGHMDVISIVSDGFNIYFPILIVLLCVCTYFSLGSRVLQFLGFQQFIGDDDMTQELMDEGREIVARERRKLERKADGEARRRNWNERFGDGATQRESLEDSGELNIRRATKYSLPRSPDENDRTELLRQVEPVDYTGGDNSDLLEEYMKKADNDTGSYQSWPASSSSRVSSTRQPSRPPKGIFDDV